MWRAAARVLLVALAAGLTLHAASCTSERNDRLPETGATLEGTVKYGKEDLQFALVIVVGPDGPASTGKIEEDGKYKVENCPLGEVKVAVNTDAGMGDYKSAIMSKSFQGPEAKGAKKAALRFIEVPKTYHDPATTPLKTTVNKGPNTYDIVIPR
ncbi:MAG: hypothetical protein L0241_26050 [Planctomycetia bacterium]|nr:hypothetical protein [Planctomycetia bacterium]